MLQMDPHKRLPLVCLIYYLFMVFSTAFEINTLRVILNYDSIFIYLIKQSFWIFLLIYIIMICSLYQCPSAFNSEFRIFLLTFSFNLNTFMGCVGYYILNFIVELPTTLNLIIYIFFSVILSSIGVYYESQTFIEKVNIKCEKLKGNLKIAHLTDLHLGALYGKEFTQKIVNLLKLENNIDFAVITGDLIDGNISLTKEMLQPFDQLNYPIYYVTGNHEGYVLELDKAMDIIHNESNLTHLDNKKVVFKNQVNVIGVDYTYTKNAVDLLNNLVKDNEQNLPNIFLYHAPIFRPVDLIGVDVFLFLCGHIHGGGFFPFTLLVLIFRNQCILEGLYNYMNKYFVYCASGLGTTGPCIRSGSKSKIAIINVEGMQNTLY